MTTREAYTIIHGGGWPERKERALDKLYDIIFALISDIPYDATTWDANTDAASKNAIRDWIEDLLDGTNMISPLRLPEITTPTPVDSVGALYPKDNNWLYFQDGAGNEHLAHGTSFASMWFHGLPVAVSIGTEDLFTLIDSFAILGPADDLTNAVGNISTNLITLAAGATGTYKAEYHASLNVAGGASKEMLVAPGITLATAPDITDATNATPIVVTFESSRINEGDMVRISGVGGNTAANGDWMLAGKSGDTYQLLALDGSNSSGNGAYTSGGTVDICWPGNLVSHREISQLTLGVVSAAASIGLAGGDIMGLYTANLDDTNNLNIYTVEFGIDLKND